MADIAEPTVPSSGADPPTLTPECIFRDHMPRIYNLARRMLDNDADAEDVTQEVLLQVIRKLDTFRGEADITTWLHRVTVNAALAARQKRANREKHSVGEPTEDTFANQLPSSPVRAWSVAPDESILADERRAIIESAIRKLPADYRDVYVLADVEEQPNAEIAATLGLSVPAVKSRLHRARLMMRDALAPHFEESAL